jgi:hypothetical protein
MCAQLPLEASQLPAPWLSDRTHFMVISRKARQVDLQRRVDLLGLPLDLLNASVGAVDALVHTGLQGVHSLVSAAASAAKQGDAMAALKSIGKQATAGQQQMTKLLFSKHKDANWEPLICSRVRFVYPLTVVRTCVSHRNPRRL